jgi:uncharacterized membrane protein
LGQGYFALTILVVLVDIIVGGSLWLDTLILISALVAGLYAMYLMYVQLRVLKHACTWCFVPTIAAVSILFATFGLFAI